MLLPDFDSESRIYNSGFSNGREKLTDLVLKTRINNIKLPNNSYR